jgi:hypothetical protein
MNESLPALKHFQLSDPEAVALRAEFQPVLKDTDFMHSQQLKQVLSNYKGVQGIYFWVMKQESVEYKIYVGKTKSLSDRVLNYISEFQPHSPNDYKLRIFQAFIVTLMPGATLDLYFAKQDPANLTRAENEAIRKYGPFLNQLAAPTAEAKDELKKAFALYYQATFERKLRI